MNRSTSADSMATDISSLRERYTKGTLEESELPENPVYLFQTWLDDAIKAKVN